MNFINKIEEYFRGWWAPPASENGFLGIGDGITCPYKSILELI